MDDDIFGRINQLVQEERQLAGDSETADERHARRLEIEAQLDQCWDLLRQRQARREFGENADDAEARPVAEVEGYLQ
jgi:uncharacterized protein DUF2630